MGDIQKTIGNLPDCDLKTILSTQISRTTRDVEELREHLATWFDESMDRVSGWYKRQSQKTLFLIAVLVCGFANADSFMIAERLWMDEKLRAEVVTAAEGAIGKNLLELCGEDKQTSKKCQEAVAARALSLPIGWSEANRPVSDFGWFGKVFGIQ